MFPEVQRFNFILIILSYLVNSIFFFLQMIQCCLSPADLSFFYFLVLVCEVHLVNLKFTSGIIKLEFLVLCLIIICPVGHIPLSVFTKPPEDMALPAHCAQAYLSMSALGWRSWAKPSLKGKKNHSLGLLRLKTYQIFLLKTKTKWLGILAVLPEGPDSVLSNNMVAHTSVNTVSRDLMPSSSLWEHQTHTWCINIYSGNKAPIYIR